MTSTRSERTEGLRWLSWCVSVLIALILTGCAGTRPIPFTTNNICRLFQTNHDWFQAADRAAKRWRVPIPVMMAIMYQESKFASRAKPARTKCCLMLPGPRPSTAYGYAQALDTTWAKYQEVTDNPGADRDNFADAIDFVGWYCYLSHVKCGIPTTDVYSLYLAYHEGHGGFTRKTYANKSWLRQVARKVQRNANVYSQQLASCEGDLRRSGGCCLWPF